MCDCVYGIYTIFFHDFYSVKYHDSDRRPKAVGRTMVFVEAPSLYGSNGFGPIVRLFVRARFSHSDRAS